MKRCNKPAFYFSWFNGFRACHDCISKGRGHEFDSMVVSELVQGPCDRPIETRAEFFERWGR